MIEVLNGQLEAARQSALIMTAPDLGTIVVTGADRKSWLNGLVTCDLAKLSVGQGAFGLHVAKAGKVQAELWILVGADRVLVGASAEALPGLMEVFDRHLIMEDADVAISEGYAWSFLHGPRSSELLEVARASGATGALVDLTGLGGAAIATPLGSAGVVGQALLGEGAVEGTREGWEQLRIERGVPRFGVDYTTQNYPQEASIEKLAVSFNKGCYLGQETVCMLELRGHVKKKLVQLELAAGAAVGAEVSLPDGALIGDLTSVGLPGEDNLIKALGYVKYKHAHAGTSVLVGGQPATILRDRPAAAG